jgi:hypothetical protein
MRSSPVASLGRLPVQPFLNHGPVDSTAKNHYCSFAADKAMATWITGTQENGAQEKDKAL